MAKVFTLEKIIALGLAALALLFFFIFSKDVNHWQNLQPELEVNQSSWQFIVDQPDFDCTASSPQNKCPAHPDSEIWKKEVPPAQKNSWKKELKNGFDKAFWIRIDLDAAKMQQLRATKANYLIFGKIAGDAQIFVNGKLAYQTSHDDRWAHVFGLPMDEVLSQKSLTLSLRIKPELGAQNILPMMENLQEGFVSKEKLTRIQTFLDFIDKTKAFALFITYFLLSGIFLTLWFYNPVAREYKSLAALAIANAVPELVFGESFWFQVSYAWNNNVFFLFISFKIIAILSLGWSFSRLQVSNRMWVASSIALSLFSLMAPNAFLSPYRAGFLKWGVCSAMLAGALACISQIIQRKNSEKAIFIPEHRKSKLIYFSLISVVLAAIYLSLFNTFTSNLWTQIMWGLPDLAFVGFLGFLAFTDYRKQMKLLESVPVSEFHRRPDIPEKVKGTVLILDIKKSESIFRSTSFGAEQFMPILLTEIWKTFAAHGATILKAEGDEVIAFFDQSRIGKAVPAAVKACADCHERLRNLLGEFKSLSPDVLPETVLFRAALAKGEIKPIWLGTGTSKFPAWVQVGGTQVFVDASRLLELERDVGEPENHSQLVIPKELIFEASTALESNAKSILEKGITKSGKHGKKYDISVIGWARPSSIKENLKKIA